MAATDRRRMGNHDWGWQDDAACKGEDLVLFFGPEGERQPEREMRERYAKDVCRQCVVRVECLDYALTRPEKYGTWGGLNEDERASARRRQMRRAAMADVSALPDEKCCNRCGETKPASEFNRERSSHDGLRSSCRPCQNSRGQAQEVA